MEQAELIRMANQIAAFFKSYGPEEATKEIATHINNFWEPRMRAKFFEHLAAGGAEFDPLVIEASKLVRKPGSAAGNMREAKDPHSGLPKEAKEA